MRRSFWLQLSGLLLTLGIGAFHLHLRAQQAPKANDRPGVATYKPTKLEWAALELQPVNSPGLLWVGDIIVQFYSELLHIRNVGNAKQRFDIG
jgi:hypothetical protein